MSEDQTNGVQGSAVGTIADLKEGEVLLPTWVERRSNGLFFVPATVGEGDFRQFVEGVFGVGARFAGLDYPLFLNLLYEIGEPVVAPAKLADDIVAFPPERQAFYRGVKIAPDKGTAEYLFEPIYIETDKTPPVSEAVRLNSDEFVAALWAKGVRFGIDVELVREAIAAPQSQRLQVARMLAPTPGQDATLEEKTDALHRSDAPKIGSDGRMDLSRFKNRFPQIKANVKLLQKIPRRLGKTGWNVVGAPLEPEIPKDFDIAPLAGPGTRVEMGTDGECLFSARDGFLNIDAKTNQISITDKIVSREGVSMKTTGDVALAGQEFEEHGEVQERRTVEGMHMTFFASVYGNIVSRGGDVVLKAGIAGGQASSPGGSIMVEGRAAAAMLAAPGGDIAVELAEGCTIVASRIKVGRAVNCDILGEEVVIGQSEGSAIAGKLIRIAESTTRKDTETIVAILSPDMARHDHDVVGLEEEKIAAEQAVVAEEAKVAQMLADEEFRKYITLATTIAKGGAKLSAAHEAKWRETQARFVPQARLWVAVQQSVAQAKQRLAALIEELAAMAEKKAHCGDGIGCSISAVAGDTLVRRMSFQPERSIVGGVQAKELAARLREFGASGDRLFWANSGEFAWFADKPADEA